MSTIILKQFSYVRRPDKPWHDWLYRRRSAYAVRQCMDAFGGTPCVQESSSNISSRKPVNFKSERYDETRVLTLRTRHISNLLNSMLLKIFAFQCAVYAINVSITNASPPESWETPVQHKLFQYNMTYDKIAPHFTNRSASIIQFYA